MAIFDKVVGNSPNFKGYTGNPPTTKEEYDVLDCWSDKSSAPSWDSVSTDMASEEVRSNRRNEYPDWQTQLNKIYDDGLTKWKSEMVDPVKAKWPKDNSGPV